MKQKKKQQEVIIDSYDYLGKSASVMDCTGLIPSAPQNDYELESYEDVFPFRPPHIEGEKGPSAVSGKVNTHSTPDRDAFDARG